MASVPAIPALDNTMGALFIGVVLSTGLWGASCIQLYYYAERFPNDALHLKALVLLTWVLDTTHQALITHTSYTYLVTHYAQPAYLDHVVKSLWAMVLFSGLTCVVVQLFLVWRIWRLLRNLSRTEVVSQRNVYIVAVLLSLVFGEFATVLVYFIKSASFTSFASLPSIANTSRAVNAMGAASDLAIALTLVALLHRARTGFKRSETIINRLILFSINTGLLTSMCAVLSLITITVYPNTFIYMAFFVCVSRLYTNTLYATLNARRSNAAGGAEDSDGYEEQEGFGNYYPSTGGAGTQQGGRRQRPTPSTISMCRFETSRHGGELATTRTVDFDFERGLGRGELKIMVDTETMRVEDDGELEDDVYAREERKAPQSSISDGSAESALDGVPRIGKMYGGDVRSLA